MNFIHTIKFRFTLWYLAILSILLILLASGVYVTLSRVLHRNLDDSLRIRAEQLSKFRDIVSIVAGGTFEEETGELISFYFYSGGQLMHISHKGFRIPVSTELIDLALSGKGSFSKIETEQNGKLRIYAAPFTPDNPHIRPARFFKPENSRQRVEIRSAALIVARPTRDIEEALLQLLQILIIAVPLTIVFAGGGGVFLAKRAFKPVEQMANTAREIEESDLSRRIDVKTKDELGMLASTLNQMIERLERAFQRQKEFTSDASHELRAPLAVIKAEASLALEKDRDPQAYRKSLEAVSQEADNMSVVINQLLTLARADAEKERLEFIKLDMAEFLRDLCVDMEILCREKGLRLHLERFDKLLVRGNKRGLKNLIHNLLSNAIRYTPKGGAISVMLRKKGNMAVVSVTDTGIGIPSDDLPFIFERFYRVDKARSRDEGGSGLGLAICQHIADIHGGSIEVESQVKKGSTFQVKLPCKSSAIF